MAIKYGEWDPARLEPKSKAFSDIALGDDPKNYAGSNPRNSYNDGIQSLTRQR